MSLRAVVYRLGQTINVVSMVALLLVMVLIGANTLLRSLFDKPILGTYEIVCLASSIVVFFAMARTEHLKGHITVTFLVSRFSLRAQIIFEVIASFFGVVVCSLICWEGISFGNDFYTSKEVTTALGLPIYPFAYGMSLGFGVMGLMFFLNIYDSIINKRSHK